MRLLLAFLAILAVSSCGDSFGAKAVRGAVKVAVF